MSNFKYEELVQNALMNVVRNVLQSAARDGFTGDHHFYVRFRTDHPKTSIPFFLKEKHPEEVMIVIQHQFWNLTVKDTFFSIDLAFSGIQQTLTIPFAAITAFVDPSVKFALQFTPNFDDAPSTDPEPDNKTKKQGNNETAEKQDGTIISFDSLRKK